MPEIRFFVEGIHPRPHTLTPTLAITLRVVNATPEPIHSILLRCQVQINAPRRRHSPPEQERLLGLFSTPERWGETLRPLHWQSVAALVGGFTGATVIELDLACTLDFHLAATQYLDALPPASDPVPLRLLFNGTVFYAAASGLQAAPIDWNLEATYAMPASAWRACLEAHYGNGVWLRLDRDSFDRLLHHRNINSHISWEQTIELLLRSSGAEVAV